MECVEILLEEVIDKSQLNKDYLLEAKNTLYEVRRDLGTLKELDIKTILSWRDGLLLSFFFDILEEMEQLWSNDDLCSQAAYCTMHNLLCEIRKCKIQQNKH